MNPKSPERIKILDVAFDCVTSKEALQISLNALQTVNSLPKNPPQQNKGVFFIATPNPEMLLEARKNPEFKQILNAKTNLNIPDGIGIIFASKFTKRALPERVTGTDLLQAICHFVPKGTKIFLLGAAPGVAEKVKSKLKSKYSQINIVGTLSGSPSPAEESEIIKKINNSDAQILFVAFGAPKQEMWIARNIKSMPKLKLAMGIGGAFDFIAGIKKRAPYLMRKTGLEWLFRLIIEPRRIKRIYNATIKFPIFFLIDKLKRK